MVTRSAVAALALASLLVLAGCTGLSSSPDAQQPDAGTNVTVQVDDGGEGSTVAVGGRASVTAEPDAATVRLQVVAAGEDPETVRNRLSRNASAARQALLDYGLDEEQVRSEAFRIRENYRARRDPDADLPAFRGAHELVIELEDTDAVGEVIDAAVESAPVRVEGVQFGLSDERRERLRDEALAQAIEDARSEAELVATAENLELRSAERIATDRVSVDEPEGTVVRQAAATPTEAGGDAAGSTRVESGEVTVRASVTVVYNASKTGG
jgi:uncharacterized protein YggE